jgi:hypothetical protein
MRLIFILITVLFSLAGKCQNSSAIKVLFLDYNKQGIPNQRAFLIFENDTLQVKYSDSNGIARFDSLAEGKYKVGIKTDYCYTRLYTNLIQRSKITRLVKVELSYPCIFSECNPTNCPSKYKGEHKILSIRYNSPTSTYKYYFKIKNNVLYYWDDRLDDTCRPHFYCKKHHAFF